ncbi:hypothetical protein P7D22_14805 [Lichenihabitans sp. Uapishka_5]|uniref:hypothetical protein n=1 Tax=Lichenihabitans sp. Uapishka_5 TaxID=3037302 RepID=UPI0029E7F1E4|nr:hypothetical protein [Lichenihabitans sp. Uapishka_5]MDX7952438.1 hypothetical protein [Lichenihabitans sp. Uapishka_5]
MIDDELTGNGRQQTFAHPLGVQRVPGLNDVTLRLGVAPEVRKDPPPGQLSVEINTEVDFSELCRVLGMELAHADLDRVEPLPGVLRRMADSLT